MAEQGQNGFRALAVVGKSGLRKYGGIVSEEYLQQLRGIKGMRFYQEMHDNSSVLGAIDFVIDSLVREVPWTVETAKGMKDNREAVEQKEFLESVMADMSHTWASLISEIMSFIKFGFSTFEIVYKQRKGETNDPTTRSKFEDGKWGWRRIDARAQDTIVEWKFQEDDDGIEGFWQDVDGKRFFIPIEKALLFRTRTTKNNPEGRSLYRSAVTDYHYFKRTRENEAIGIGRDLTGMIVMEVPEEILAVDASGDQLQIRQALETMVQQIQVDERMGVVIPSQQTRDGKPSGYNLRLMQGGGARAIDTDKIIRRHESRIAGSVLAEFIMIGQDKVGTQSLFQGKSNLFGIAMGTLLDSIATVFNTFAVARLMRLNGVRPELWPVMVHGDVAAPDLDKVAALITSMAGASILSPNKPLEKKLLEGAGLPTPEDENDPLLDPTAIVPADGVDQATGLLSERQLKAVLDINTQLKAGTLDRVVAIKLIASSLGVDEPTAQTYLSEETDEDSIAEEFEPRGDDA